MNSGRAQGRKEPLDVAVGVSFVGRVRYSQDIDHHWRGAADVDHLVYYYLEVIGRELALLGTSRTHIPG